MINIQSSESFYKTVSYNDKRCEINLPWISDWTFLEDNFKHGKIAQDSHKKNETLE